MVERGLTVVSGTGLGRFHSCIVGGEHQSEPDRTPGQCLCTPSESASTAGTENPAARNDFSRGVSSAPGRFRSVRTRVGNERLGPSDAAPRLRRDITRRAIL
jgi:hypothetical protein